MLLLYGIAVPVGGLVVSYFSSMITVGTSHEYEATIGVIRFAGFPVWSLECAPGISIMSSWKFERFLVNTAIWIAGFLVLTVLIHRKFKGRKHGDVPTNPCTVRAGAARP